MLKTPNATPGHTDLNSDKPTHRRFDEIELDGDLVGFDAAFITFGGELERVEITNASKAIGDDDLPATGCEMELMEAWAFDWWEGR